MKHIVLTASITLSIIVITVAFHVAYAAAVGKPFGGTIINTKATEIQSLENSNYSCVVPGTTITIKSVVKSAPTTYFIPAGVKAKVGYAKNGSKIKGLYSQSKTTITCIFQGTPPSQQTVQLTPITMYGTSR